MDPIEQMEQIAAESYAKAADAGEIGEIQTITLDDPMSAAVATRDGGVGTRVFLDVETMSRAALDTMMDDIDAQYGGIQNVPEQMRAYYAGYRDSIMALLTGGMAISLAYDTQNLSPQDFS